MSDYFRPGYTGPVVHGSGANRAALGAFWDRCGCLAGFGEIPSVSDCHQAALCKMRHADRQRDAAGLTLVAALRAVFALADELDEEAGQWEQQGAENDRAGFPATGDVQRENAAQQRAYADRIRATVADALAQARHHEEGTGA